MHSSTWANARSCTSFYLLFVSISACYLCVSNAHPPSLCAPMPAQGQARPYRTVCPRRASSMHHDPPTMVPCCAETRVGDTPLVSSFVIVRAPHCAVHAVHCSAECADSALADSALAVQLPAAARSASWSISTGACAPNSMDSRDMCTVAYERRRLCTAYLAAVLVCRLYPKKA